MSEEPEAVHNTEQNKDRMSLCTHNSKYSDPADPSTNCIYFQNNTGIHIWKKQTRKFEALFNRPS